MKNFKGTGVALVTPFKKDLTIDEKALRKLVRLQIEGGTDFLVVQGTSAESPVLSPVEKLHTLNIIADENNGALPIVYGVGGNNTLAVANQLKVLKHEAVDGILSVSPYYNKPTQAGIVKHFEILADNTDLPIILYNVPGRTASNISAESVLRLAEIKNIVSVKEASGDMSQIMEIIRNAPKDFSILSGDDPLTLPMIASGAHGVISVVANALPEMFSKMIDLCMEEDFKKARKLHLKMLPITSMFFQEGNPAGVKAALEYRDICSQQIRMPLLPVSKELEKSIVKQMKKLLEKA